MVLFEGTNISEGRGTTMPFQIFGAPFIDQGKLIKYLVNSGVEGASFRPICYQPTFDKWAGQTCYGFQIHVINRDTLQPFKLGLALLQALYHEHKGHFQWLPPPYEYEWEKQPIDILFGDGTLRQRIEDGEDLSTLEASWTAELQAYKKRAEQCLLYQ
jgi:uncharacterized protein YbbC (DUF1343 family)